MSGNAVQTPGLLLSHYLLLALLYCYAGKQLHVLVAEETWKDGTATSGQPWRAGSMACVCLMCCLPYRLAAFLRLMLYYTYLSSAG